jgi:hypothetical protein
MRRRKRGRSPSYLTTGFLAWVMPFTEDRDHRRKILEYLIIRDDKIGLENTELGMPGRHS